MTYKPLLFVLALIIHPLPKIVHADEQTEIYSRLIEITCVAIKNTGSSSTVSFSAEAKVEAKGLIGKLIDSGAHLDADGFWSKYDNVPREDLSEMLDNEQSCRMEVFRTIYPNPSGNKSTSIGYDCSANISGGTVGGSVNVCSD